uniref:Uncharacterized protein n=1 Tax=Schizophyllum commune (strain H4-8 / FGSC 9210) TaxID=578458 RepID=D8Q3Y9_SCHCM
MFFRRVLVVNKHDEVCISHVKYNSREVKVTQVYRKKWVIQRSSPSSTARLSSPSPFAARPRLSSNQAV